MSDVYPYGFYPRSSTVPVPWEAGIATSVVQYRGLVYFKTERHTGGTGKPNEEVDGSGLRTWGLYSSSFQGGSAANGAPGNRMFIMPLHSVIGYNSTAIIYDQDTYSWVSNYFIHGSFAFPASYNGFPASPMTTAHCIAIPSPYLDNTPSSAGGIFTVWGELYTPTSYLSTTYGLNGYSSDPPGTSPPTPPPTLSPVDLVINNYISCPLPLFVGRTYTGFIEKLEATASWVFNGTGYDYVVAAPTVTQVPITYTVTQQNYIDYVEGTTPYPYPTVTHSVTGGADYWVGWGQVVLTSVTPDATS